jgi:hypothetical protein
VQKAQQLEVHFFDSITSVALPLIETPSCGDAAAQGH